MAAKIPVIFFLSVFSFQSARYKESTGEKIYLAQAEITSPMLLQSKNWPSFRGANASGFIEGQNIPLHWDIETAQNIKWKINIPGLGHSSPIIWEDKLFLTTSVRPDSISNLDLDAYRTISHNDHSEHSWLVYCIDKNSGKVFWKRTAHAGAPKVGRHPKGTQANSTPVTDGKHVVVLFGAEGLYCYSLEGELFWKKTIGYLDSGYYADHKIQYGHASSPIIYKNSVIVQADKSNDSFIAAYRLKDGKQLWKTPRNVHPSWSTPTVYESSEQTVVVANGGNYIIGYKPINGQEVWRLLNSWFGAIPSPVVTRDLIILCNTPGQPIYAIKGNARGDLSHADSSTSNTFIKWSQLKGGSYIPTPIVYGDYFYVCGHNGVVSVYDLESGQRLNRKRLGGQGRGYRFSASPVAAGGFLYFFSEDGIVFVVEANPGLKTFAENELSEIIMASPAISEHHLYIRSQNHLWSISEQTIQQN